MYTGARWQEALVVLGTFGLAALAPSPPGPTWLIVCAITLPYVLFEIGQQFLEAEWYRRGAIIQLAGAVAYVTLFVVFSLIGADEAKSTGRVLSLAGFTIVVTVVRDSVVILRPPIPRARIVRSRA